VREPSAKDRESESSWPDDRRRANSSGHRYLARPAAALFQVQSAWLFEEMAERAWVTAARMPGGGRCRCISTAAETAGWGTERLGERFGVSEASRYRLGSRWPPPSALPGRRPHWALRARGKAG